MTTSLHLHRPQELDLTAADIDNEGAAALSSVLQFNSALTLLRLPFNPALDHDMKLSIIARVEECKPSLRVEL